MKRNLLLLIGIIAIIFPINLNAQEAPKISGYVQGLYQANINSDFDLTGNTLRMRRVRMSLDGKITNAISYKIQGDFVNSPMLVDAYLKFKPYKEFAIQIGQFKTPFSMESPINPVNLEIFDYGESVKGLAGYNDVCGVGKLGRDIGIMASGELFPVEGQDYNILTYNIGLFNGNGPCVTDNNNRKDLVGRLDVHPMLKELTLSGSFYFGKYKQEYDLQGRRMRWSGGAQYKDGNLMVRAEYLGGSTGMTEMYEEWDEQGVPHIIEEERYFSSHGYYAIVGYTLHFGKDYSQKITPIARFEHFTPNKFENDPQAEFSNYYTVGFDYWPMKTINFKLDYSLVQNHQFENANSHRVVGILSYKF